MNSQDINTAIGKRLAARRRTLRLSLAQVSKRCGVSLQQIHKYETGQTVLTVPRLLQLARCLNVSPGYFFEDLEPPSELRVETGASAERRPG